MNLLDEDWWAHAVCAETDPDAFVPEKGRVDQVRAAKRVCAHCPVAAQCLEYALEHGERYGVWGGKSERERRVMRRGTAPSEVTAKQVQRIKQLGTWGLTQEVIAGQVGVQVRTVRKYLQEAS